MSKRKTHSRTRTVSSHGRFVGDRSSFPQVLVVCEGSETERLYFKALREHWRLRTLTLHSGYTPAEAVVQRAIELREERKRIADRGGDWSKPVFDEVWGVFDSENQLQNPSFIRAKQLAKEQGIQLAISHPSFEFWLLLHFKETSRPFMNAEEVKNELRQFLPEYDKNVDIFPSLDDKIAIAIQRAERIIRQYPQGNESMPNPSTTVFELMNLLQTMSPQS